MAIDTLRHQSIFSPEEFGHKQVDVIGVGATGSRVALSLAKLGIENIHIWDFDTVAEHNIPNQIFGPSDIGQLKVDCTARIIKEATGTKLSTHAEKVDGSQTLGQVVFLLTDTMKSRQEIWAGALKYHLGTSLVIETRMGADNGRVYSLNPNQPSHIKAWEETLYDDAAAEVSLCGAAISVGPTAEIISGLAVWQMIRWFNIGQGKEGEEENEIIFSLCPMQVISRQF